MASTFMKIRSGIGLKPSAQPSDPQNGDLYYDSSTNQITVYLNGTWTTLLSTGVYRAGQQSIGSGLNTISVTFSSAMANTNYAINAVLRNGTDANPQFQAVTITTKSTTGFTALWNANTDTANYSLEWSVISNA